MPMALAVDKLSNNLTSERIRGMVEQNHPAVDQLAQRDSLVDVAKTLGLEDHEAEYIAAIPVSLREGIRGAVLEAVSAGKSIHLQYSPGYDFSVQMWDYGEGLSVHVSGPYPPRFPRDRYEPPKPSNR
jgi:hypothetical protein